MLDVHKKYMIDDLDLESSAQALSYLYTKSMYPQVKSLLGPTLKRFRDRWAPFWLANLSASGGGRRDRIDGHSMATIPMSEINRKPSDTVYTHVPSMPGSTAHHRVPSGSVSMAGSSRR